MDNIYNYFKTEKSICKDTNNLKKNDILNPKIYKKSILLKYKSEFNKLKKTQLNKNYNAASDLAVNDLYILFDNLLITNDINRFCNSLYSKKRELSTKKNIKSDIKNLISSNKIKNGYETIVNPLYSSLVIPNVIRNSSSFINNNIINDINLDILSQGKYINLSYPTLGIIENKLTKSISFEKYRSLLSFFNDILYNIHYKFEDDNSVVDSFFKLPLQGLNFGNTINKILSNNNLEKISSISDYINTTTYCLKDIMTVKEISKDKTKIYFVSKYIIPYEIKNDELVSMKTNKIIKYIKNYKSYLENEKYLFDYIYTNLKNRRTNLNKEDLNDCFKIMYLFCYRNIIIFHDMYWNFINKKVNQYVMSLKISNNKIYKKLNYDNFIEYIDKINKSLSVMKKILLNNLYKIFRPNIVGKNYGIIFNYENELKPVPSVDNKVLYTGNDIFSKLFFKENCEGIATSNLFNEFDSNDLYDEEMKLFIGVSFDNNNNLNDSLGLFNINDNILKTRKSFNLKLINILIKYFKTCIPIEMLRSITSKKNYLKHTRLSDKEKNNLKNYILKEFKKYLKESTENIIMIKKSKDNKEAKKNLLKSKMNYNMSYSIYRIVQTSLYDIDLKNKILDEINKIKNNYLQIIKEKLK